MLGSLPRRHNESNSGNPDDTRPVETDMMTNLRDNFGQQCSPKPKARLLFAVGQKAEYNRDGFTGIEYRKLGGE